MTPIFALYKKWQQRQAANPKKEKEKEGSKSNNGKNLPPPTILRPSELYFQKLTPKLNSLNIKTAQSSRKEWPLSVLKEVIFELKCNIIIWLIRMTFDHWIIYLLISFLFKIQTAETPCDLLAKELWWVFELNLFSLEWF